MSNMMVRKAKYVQIEDYFIHNIENGNYELNRLLPSEAELCDQFSTSRMTVNKAMTNLSNRGYIRRIPGNGSFVDDAYNNPKSDLIQKHSLSDEIRAFGMEPGSQLLDYQIIKGKDNRQIAKELNVKDDEFIHYFVRLRTGDGKPVVLSYTYINYSLLPNFDIRCLEGSFNAYISEQGIIRSSGYTEFSAVLPDEKQAEIIGSSNKALLRQKIFWRYANKPFEITTHYYLDDRMSIVINRDHDDTGEDVYKKTIALDKS
jgi:DNA-binding GntR family transcriptional regulator